MQELHENWQARVYMRVFSTFIAWSNENKSCMRVDKREFTWEFSKLSLLDQTRTRVARELRSESLHESFLNFHCLIKREQELHESWEARVIYMRVFSTFIAWSNENKSCMRVDKREFTWEFSQLSLLDQTRTRVAWELTSESLHESFLNFHCLIKREQELHESWQARVYMRVFSTFIAWSNENKSCMHESWQARVTWEFSLHFPTLKCCECSRLNYVYIMLFNHPSSLFFLYFFSTWHDYFQCWLRSRFFSKAKLRARTREG
jgi:hypothetical protein